MTIMKLKQLTLAALAAVSLAACDEVDVNDRTTYVEPVKAQRSVLIEDFTGQSCINCPSATEMIHQLQANPNFGDKIIAVGIHSGGFSKRPPTYTKPFELWTATGDEYFNYWKISSQPKGIVNRRAPELDYEVWPQAVAAALESKTALEIDIENSYDPQTKKLTINTYLSCLQGTPSVSGKLQLWIVQDNITAMQYFPGNVRDAAYVHNHVLRCAVNGTWGEDVTVKEDEIIALKHEIQLDETTMEQGIGAPAYVPEDVSVVAFVYNDNGVENVAQMPVIAKE